jgi:hypothetical protein
VSHACQVVGSIAGAGLHGSSEHFVAEPGWSDVWCAGTAAEEAEAGAVSGGEVGDAGVGLRVHQQ